MQINKIFPFPNTFIRITKVLFKSPDSVLREVRVSIVVLLDLLGADVDT